MAVRKPSIHFFWAYSCPGISGRLIGFFDRGEGNRERSLAGNPPPLDAIVRNYNVVCKQLIINEILVEATGVELFSVLTAHKLLILGTARTAKKAPFPDPLYVCTF